MFPKTIPKYFDSPHVPNVRYVSHVHTTLHPLSVRDTSTRMKLPNPEPSRGCLNSFPSFLLFFSFVLVLEVSFLGAHSESSFSCCFFGST